MIALIADSAAQQAAAAAWKRAHPLTLLAISTVISLLIISLFVAVRWLVSMSAWKYHPGKAMGFLKDEFARWGVAIGPILLIGMFLKAYIYLYRQDLDTPNTWMIYGVCMIAIRIVVRRMPYVKAVARHIDAAKAEARAAKAEGRG
ncbi:hypothetical protein [Asticcacaulis solisilvae]|uniref:hypothetical protein n=1 Tax=Asticcacaulis solisilvae TaxID=1217274 RepID=UPI003FD75A96